MSGFVGSNLLGSDTLFLGPINSELDPEPTITIETYLGDRLIRWLLDYETNESSGTWIDVIGGPPAIRNVAGQYPTAGVTPTGQSYPIFDGSNDNLRSTSLSSIFPTYNKAHHKIWGFGLYLPSAGAGTNRWIYGVDSFNYYITSGNIINIAGTMSNSAVAHDVWHTLIVIWNGSTCTQYLDGIAQTTTSTSEFASTWTTTGENWYGDRPGGGYPYNGNMLSMFWGHDATNAFTQDDVIALHDIIMKLTVEA